MSPAHDAIFSMSYEIKLTEIELAIFRTTYFGSNVCTQSNIIFSWVKSLWQFHRVYRPADTRRLINVGLTLVQYRRRWTSVKPTLIKRLVSAGRA